MLVTQGELGDIRLVAGADVACPKGEGKAIGGVVVFSYPELELVEKAAASRPLSFPYVPGLLAFREAPAVLDAFEKLRSEPDVIIFDAQGYAHPRRLGLASHLGILLDKPSVGCAKSVLVGKYGQLGEEVGSTAPMVDGGEVVGAALRTRHAVSPVFVSIGHKLSLEAAIKMVLNSCCGFRLPEPSRQAHKLVSGPAPDEKTPPSQLNLF